MVIDRKNQNRINELFCSGKAAVLHLHCFGYSIKKGRFASFLWTANYVKKNVFQKKKQIRSKNIGKIRGLSTFEVERYTCT